MDEAPMTGHSSDDEEEDPEDIAKAEAAEAEEARAAKAAGIEHFKSKVVGGRPPASAVPSRAARPPPFNKPAPFSFPLQRRPLPGCAQVGGGKASKKRRQREEIERRSLTGEEWAADALMMWGYECKGDVLQVALGRWWWRVVVVGAALETFRESWQQWWFGGGGGEGVRFRGRHLPLIARSSCRRLSPTPSLPPAPAFLPLTNFQELEAHEEAIDAFKLSLRHLLYLKRNRKAEVMAHEAAHEAARLNLPDHKAKLFVAEKVFHVRNEDPSSPTAKKNAPSTQHATAGQVSISAPAPLPAKARGRWRARPCSPLTLTLGPFSLARSLGSTSFLRLPAPLLHAPAPSPSSKKRTCRTRSRGPTCASTTSPRRSGGRTRPGRSACGKKRRGTWGGSVSTCSTKSS